MVSNQAAPNQYYMYINKELLSWDIFESNPGNRGFVRYFGKVLQTIEKRLPNRGLTFYITMTEMQELPTYGNNVIVLILGDEFYRTPKYCHKVGAIFKCYGTHQVRPLLNAKFLLIPSYITVLMVMQILKNLVHRFPLRLIYKIRRLKYKVRYKLRRLKYKIKYKLRKVESFVSEDRRIAPIYNIPLGYYNSEPLPIKPIEARRHDVFFDGSVVNARYPMWSFRYWSKSPKAVAREQMILNLQRFKEKYPQFDIQLSTIFSFAASQGTPGDSSYSQNMMDTKVCLVPRGTTFETYRFFEAMRYGCIIITEHLPSRWFYDGSPAIQIRNWQNLEGELKKLLENKELMQHLHQQTLAWWENKCSETAVGNYMIEKLNDLLEHNRSIAEPMNEFHESYSPI